MRTCSLDSIIHQNQACNTSIPNGVHWVVAPYVLLGPPLEGSITDTELVTTTRLTNILDTTYLHAVTSIPDAVRRLIQKRSISMELLGISGSRSPPPKHEFLVLIHEIKTRIFAAMDAKVAPPPSSSSEPLFVLYIQDRALLTGGVCVAMILLALISGASLEHVREHAIKSFTRTSSRLAFVKAGPDDTFEECSDTFMNKPILDLPLGGKLREFVTDICRVTNQTAIPELFAQQKKAASQLPPAPAPAAVASSSGPSAPSKKHVFVASAAPRTVVVVAAVPSPSSLVSVARASSFLSETTKHVTRDAKFDKPSNTGFYPRSAPSYPSSRSSQSSSWSGSNHAPRTASKKRSNEDGDIFENDNVDDDRDDQAEDGYLF